MKYILQFDATRIPCRDAGSGLNYALQCFFRSDREMFGHWLFLHARHELPDSIEYIALQFHEIGDKHIIPYAKGYLYSVLRSMNRLPAPVGDCPQWEKLIHCYSSPPPILNFVTNLGAVGRFYNQTGDGALLSRIQSFLW